MFLHRPRHFVFLAVASALFASAPAHAQQAPGSETGEPTIADEAYPDDPQAAEATGAEPAAEEDSPRLERIKVQGFGAGYHAVLFRTEAGERFALHGPSVTYDYFVGRRWGFAIHGEAFFPFFGRYSGEAPDFRGQIREKYDARHYGLDLSFMAAFRANLSDELVFFGAAGVHTQTVVVDSASYLPVQLISLGLALTGRLQWNFHPRLFLSANFMAAFDPFDMIHHQNKATIAFPLSGALSLGVRY